MSYNLAEIHKLKISISKRRTGLKQMQARHEAEMLLAQTKLEILERSLMIALNDGSKTVER